MNPPKTKSGKRVLPSTNAINTLLEEQRSAQIRERFAARGAWRGETPGKGETFVFATANGVRADRSDLTRTYQNALKDVGLKSMGIHTFRHTFATNCVQHDAKLSDTARLLGHSDPAFTIRTYVHPDREGMEKTMRRNSEVIAGK